MAMTLMALLPAMTAACRSNKTAPAVTVEKTATATLKATSADTLRTHSGSLSAATETSLSGSRGHTHIHIDRDSAGRPTDIQVDTQSASQGKTRKETSGAAVEEKVRRHQEHSESKKTSEATEAKPVKDEGRSTAGKSVAWLLCCVVLVIIGILRIGDRK